MNNSGSLRWETSDNLRDYPKTRKKGCKSLKTGQSDSCQQTGIFQKLVSLPENPALLVGFSFVSFLVLESEVTFDGPSRFRNAEQEICLLLISA
jgi:hypothetical protein